MKKIKKNTQKIIALILFLITLLSNFLPVLNYAWVSSEGQVCSSKNGDYYKSIDGGYYYSDPTMRIIVYDESGNVRFLLYEGNSRRRKSIIISPNGEEKQVFCLESGIEFEETIKGYVSNSGTNSNYFRNLPVQAQYGIMLTLIYGWRDDVPSEIAGQCNLDDFKFAVQTIIWEYQQQLRQSPTAIQDWGQIPKDMYFCSLRGRPAEIAYNWLLNKMTQHSTIPSFSSSNTNQAPIQSLKYNTSTGKYMLTVTDTNNTLADLNLDTNSGISVTRTGNQYTFSTSNMINGEITIPVTKKISLPEDKMLIWGKTGAQTMISGAEDPVRFYIKFQTENYGTAHLIKTSEDGNVEGIKFTISGNGINKIVTTGKNGTIDITNLLPRSI